MADENLEIDLKDDKKVEESKGEETKEESNSWRDVKSLQKFKDADAMGAAYLELEKKLSQSKKDLSKLSDEELVKETKDFFGKLAGGESMLEGDLSEVAKGMAEELGVPQRFVDLAISKGVETALTTQATKRLKDAQSFLEDPIKKADLTAGVKARGGEVAENFNKRLKAGQVSVSEMETLAELGRPLVEANESVSGEGNKRMSFDEMERELHHILDKKKDVWCNRQHPDFLKTKERINHLEKRLYGN